MNINEIFLNAGLTFGKRNPGKTVPADMRSNGDRWILVWIAPTDVEPRPRDLHAKLDLSVNLIRLVLGSFQ